MKKKVLSLLASVVLIFTGCATPVRNDLNPPPPPDLFLNFNNPEIAVTNMDEFLNLSRDQEAQIYIILVNRQSELAGLNPDDMAETPLRNADSPMMSIISEITDVLTDSQKIIFNEKAGVPERPALDDNSLPREGKGVR